MLENMVTERPPDPVNTAKEVANLTIAAKAAPASAVKPEQSQAHPSEEVVRLIWAIWYKHKDKIGGTQLNSELKFRSLEGFAEVARAYGQTYISVECWNRKLEVGTHLCVMDTASDTCK